MSTPPRAAQVLGTIIRRAQVADWKGWDPFDALSSPLLKNLTLNQKFGRIFWIQLLKRCPVNLRPFLGVPKLQNPKALALFASACIDQPGDAGFHALSKSLLERLILLSQTTHEGRNWGYPFDWQSRAFYAPRGTPNAVVSSFCGQAFMDGYEAFGDARYLEIATEVCEYFLSQLHRSGDPQAFCFSYTPKDRSQIHNANLLVAELLIRVGHASANEKFLETGAAACAFTLKAQKPDGSWVYGEAANQQWIDNFHTGFILVSLARITARVGGTRENEALTKGLDYYKNHFFEADGAPKYYHNQRWPLDIHSAAQALLTFSLLSQRDRSLGPWRDRLLNWTLSHMLLPQGGVIYQRGQRFVNSIPYLRWSDAWLARSLAAYLKSTKVVYIHAAN